MDTKWIVDVLKAAIDASIAFEALPVRVAKSRNGWAAFKGATRITRFYFSEDGAREAAIARDARHVKITFTDPGA